jgi:probable phosphoglycerate mutase
MNIFQMTTIIVMRHGETAWNREGRLQGWAPVTLNEYGREQATAAAAHLAEYDLDRVVSSDLTRTRETTKMVRSEIDAPVRYDDAWRERDLGVYQGLPLTRVTDSFSEFSLGKNAANASDQVPDSGESLDQVANRVVSSWQDLLASSDSSETVLVVTHGGPIQLLLGHIENKNVTDSMLAYAPGNCSITEIECGADHPTPTIIRKTVTPWN